MEKNSYALITPARNEEAYIEKTIQSVISQTMLPEKWVIVSDGSIDRTDKIVNQYAAQYDFIQLLHLETDCNRNFGSKVNAFNAGYEKLKDTKYDFIGCLDADISFEKNYYEKILLKFSQNPKMGIGGGIILDLHDGKIHKRQTNFNSVGCAVQLFRRQCFEEIGGYIPLKIGGEDAAAEAMARMHGWEVKSIPEMKVLHFRRTGTEGRGIYRARFLNGVEEYLLGYHPLFQMAKCFSRVKERPYLIGSFLRMCGYYWSWCRRYNRLVSTEFVTYLRREQMQKIWSIL